MKRPHFRPLLPGFQWALGLWLIGVILQLIFFMRLPAEIPLFYSLPSGKEQLTTKVWLLVLLLLSSIYLCINWGIAERVRPKLSILAQLFSWLTAFVCLLFLISLIHILLLVF